MGRTTEEIKLNEKTGWFIGRYHQWRKLLPNGKLSTAERAQLIHKDSWEYNHFRDKDGVIRKMSLFSRIRYCGKPLLQGI